MSYKGGLNAYTYSFNFDLLSYFHPFTLASHAAGNSRSLSCITGGYRTVHSGNQASKNGLVVGSVSNIDGNSANHSYGPSMDGRVKPDIVTKGVFNFTTQPDNTYTTQSATSFAAPNMTGGAALFYEYYRQKNSGNNPPIHTSKAIILNTTEDLGNIGPDFIYGYGRLNIKRAITVLDSGDYIQSYLHQDDSFITNLNIPISSSTSEIRFLINWFDYPVFPPVVNSLYFDLDMLVIDPIGDTIRPYILDPSNPSVAATRGIDTLNNTEQIVIDNVILGTYKVVVLGTNIPTDSAHFTFTWLEREPELKLTYPIGCEKWHPPTASFSQTISWDGFELTGTITVEFSDDNGATWTTLASGLANATRFYTWSSASSSLHTGEALIRVSTTLGGFTSTSDSTFVIMPHPQWTGPLSILCDNQVTLYWNNHSASDTFKVYQLIGEEMTEIARTTDTFYIVTGLTNGNTYWFAIAGIDSNGNQSIRSIATAHSPNATNTPPSISLQPINQDACNFSNVILHSAATGTASVQSQWQISIDNGVTWANIVGQTYDTLLIENVDSSIMSNLYRNAFYNMCGGFVYTDTISINVDSIPLKPTILATPLTACGDTTEFECNIVNANYIYNWSFQDAETPSINGINQPGPHTNQWIHPTSSGNKTIILSMGYQDNYCFNHDTLNFNVGCIALPVNFLKIEAFKELNHIIIAWTTSQEINNDYFEVEKSKDGINFYPIEKVKGQGNSFEENHYQVTDNNPLFGRQFYRIKQVDFDYNSSYSLITSVNFENHTNNDIQIFPNPTNGIITYQNSNNINISNIIVKNILGKIVLQPKPNSNTFDISELDSGIYFISFEVGNNITTYKVHLIK
jgi:hypothetical protein